MLSGNMPNFIALATAVLVANALTAMLVYALARMLKMHRAEDFDATTAACFFTPIGAIIIGLLYLKFP